MRRLPPTIFPSSAADVWRAARGGPTARAREPEVACDSLERHFERPVRALVDSGTSALTLAIRSALLRTPGLVAIPAYGCIDVPTAVMGAGGRAVAYDVDVDTLAPDGDSVDAAIDAGARVLVIAHLFGFPVDARRWRALCDRRGLSLIEDAAQWAGAMSDGRPLAHEGHWAVLSLGRGKGLVGTGGGVVLGETLDASPETIGDRSPLPDALRTASDAGHWTRAATALAAVALARPALYAIPAATPGLHLGEMVFHAPRPVGPMPAMSVRLLPSALRGASDARARRSDLAHRLLDAATRGGWAHAPTVASTAVPGFLRLPLRVPLTRALPDVLGIVRPYPRPLDAQTEVASAVVQHGRAMPGAQRLSRALITVPVHARVAARDESRLCDWLASA